MTGRPTLATPYGTFIEDTVFSDQQCDALFDAVLADDVVDAHTELPFEMRPGYSAEQLTLCFQLCRQLWKRDVDRNALLRLTEALGKDRDLSVADRLEFKHVRAKFKHLRFAFSLYGAGHRYPAVLNWVTTEMGHMQDAFKNGHRREVGRRVRLFRLLVSRPFYLLLLREVDRLQMTTRTAFGEYLDIQVAKLAAVLERPLVTGDAFHSTRKVVGRLVSFYDTLRTLDPTVETFQVSRYLSAINGLMGEFHDGLVERRAAGTQNYHKDAFALTDDVRRRIEELVEWYRHPSAVLSV